MITEHIDPMDNRKLSKDDAEFIRMVNLVLADRRCRKCGAEIIDRGPQATLCSGCAEDRYGQYRHEYAKVAWQITKAKRNKGSNETAA